MFDVVVVGSGGPFASHRRGYSSILVRHDGKTLIVDCGDGTIGKILHAAHAQRMRGIFTGSVTLLISHEHPDHYLGAAGIAFHLDIVDSADELRILAPPDTMSKVRKLLGAVEFRGKVDLNLREIEPNAVADIGRLKCEFFETHHTRESVGFIFSLPPRRQLLADEAGKGAAPAGPVRRQPTDGPPVALHDGSEVRPDEVLGDEIPGTSLVVTPDAQMNSELVDRWLGADCVIASTPFLDVDHSRAIDNRHLTVKYAAETASKASIKRLYLTHLSQVYDDADVLEEAKAIFPNASICNDGDRIEV